MDTEKFLRNPLVKPKGSSRGPKIGRNVHVKLEHPYGPAMSSLTPLQQRFVEGYVSSPMRSNLKILEDAGYKGSYEGCKKMVQRLLKNPVILDAIREASSVKLKAMTPKAVDAIEHVIEDPNHRDHVKAIFGVLDRTGLHAVAETHSTVTMTKPIMVGRIRAMAETLGLDVAKLLPFLRAETVQQESVNTDFTEVIEKAE